MTLVLAAALFFAGATVGALAVATLTASKIADLDTQIHRWRSLAQPPIDHRIRHIGDDPAYWQHPMPYPTGEAAAPDPRQIQSDGPMPIDAGEPPPARPNDDPNPTSGPEETCSRTN